MAVTEEKEKKERIFIDPLAKDLKEGEAAQLDPNEDAYARIAPPDGGLRYDLHITESDENCFEQKETDSGTLYYVANLQGKIVNCPVEENNGAMVFARVSTLIGKGKSISTMAYVLLKLGYPKEKLAGEITPAKLVKKLALWLRGEDRIAKDCLLDWQGWSANLEKVVFSKMIDFPRNSKGGYDHIVDFKHKGGPSEEIVARLKIKDWGGNSAQGASGAAKGATVAPKVVKKASAPPTASTAPADDEEEAPAVVAKGGKAVKPPTPAAVSALLDGDDED